MQLNVGGKTEHYPNAAQLCLFTALKRNPRITTIKAVWGWHIMDHATNRVATYNRKTKMLWYWEANFGVEHKGEDTFYIYKGVTPSMLYKAGVQADGNAFANLDKYGCELISRRQWKR
jgi:hypothetical protein